MQTLRKLGIGIICGNNFSGGFFKIWQAPISKLVLFHAGGIVPIPLISKTVLYYEKFIQIIALRSKGWYLNHTRHFASVL